MFRYIKEHKLVSLPILTAGVIFGIMVATGVDFLPRGEAAPQADKPEAAKNTGEAGRLDIRNAFVKVAEEAGPAVVSITTERIQKIGGVRHFYYGPFSRDGRRGDPFEDFFGDFFKDFFYDIPEQQRRQMGLGSGVIIDANGYILTNEHVISGVDKITVTLSDGREYEAELKGKDPRRDLAVIKIDAKGLTAARLGDSDLVKTGEWVAAIGNPFGHLVNSPSPTVTVGVVGALHRSLPMGRQDSRIYVDLIQTDAAINPGNSGGPLCDLDGNVVGINVAIFSTTGGYQGVGFAIPINTAKSIIDDLMKGEEILYGWLGVTVQDITQDISDYFGLESKNGVLVAGVVKGGPAEKGGMRTGDIVVSFNDKPVTGVRELLTDVSRADIGDVVRIGLIRDKQSLSVNVRIERRPSEEQMLVRAETKDFTTQSWRGITVKPLTKETAAELGIEETEGVVVDKVDIGSPAYKAGIRENDVITEINRIPIRDIETYNKVVLGIKGNALVCTDRCYVVVKEGIE